MLATKLRGQGFIFCGLIKLILYIINMNIKNLETKIIFLPKNIELYKKQCNLVLKSNMGYINFILPKNINLYKKDSYLFIDIINSDKNIKTWEIIFRNAILGCSRQYLNRLVLKGVGYKVFAKNKQDMELKIGYSHPIQHLGSNTVNVNVFKNIIIQLASPLKDQLGSASASLKSLKKIDMYKGKGILFKREKLNLKVGKKA